MILVHCRPLPETRTPSSSAAWLAECEVDGRKFEARSRHGAPNELARRLVEAGVPYEALEIHHEGLAGSMRYRSFFAAARWSFAESQSTPLRRVPFREFGEASEGVETLSPGDPQCVTSPPAGSRKGGPAIGLFPAIGLWAKIGPDPRRIKATMRFVWPRVPARPPLGDILLSPMSGRRSPAREIG